MAYRVILGWMMLLAAVIASAASASAAPQTYYALVFNGPAPGRDAEYNRWYDEEHAPDVVSIPGFVSAQRYRRSDLQLRPNAAASPPYLVVYKIVTDDLAAVYREVNRRAGDGRTRMSKAMATAGGMNVTYLVTATGGRAPTDATLPRYLHVVLADARPGQEDELDRWYAAHHAPDIVTMPGFTTYAIGTFSPTQMIPDPKGQHHIALFGLATRDLAATVTAFRERAPHLTPGPDLANLWGYTYRPIGPELSGDRIRAERARAAR